MVVVEADTPGFPRGPTLGKVGKKAQDTAELYVDGCAMSRSNVLGAEGRLLGNEDDSSHERTTGDRAGRTRRRDQGTRAGPGLHRRAHHVTLGGWLARHQVVGHKLAEMHTNLQMVTTGPGMAVRG